MFLPLIIVTCLPLADPVNGAVSTNGNSFGNIATYTCDTGFARTGDDTRTCQSDGTWSGTAPTCTASMYQTIGIKCSTSVIYYDFCFQVCTVIKFNSVWTLPKRKNFEINRAKIVLKSCFHHLFTLVRHDLCNKSCFALFGNTIFVWFLPQNTICSWWFYDLYMQHRIRLLQICKTRFLYDLCHV